MKPVEGFEKRIDKRESTQQSFCAFFGRVEGAG